MSSMMSDLAFAIPGVDEAMGFAEIMKHVKSMEYSVIVFDTAPTGHTLRFLSFPTVLEKALAKFSTLGRSFGPMLGQMTSMMGGGQSSQDDMFAKLESMRAVINEVNTQFKDPDKTTFICVCISEFLSVYETERLVQELTQYEIDTHAIVCNQLLFPPKGECTMGGYSESAGLQADVRVCARSTDQTPSRISSCRLELRSLPGEKGHAGQIPRFDRGAVRRGLQHRESRRFATTCTRRVARADFAPATTLPPLMLCVPLVLTALPYSIYRTGQGTLGDAGNPGRGEAQGVFEIPRHAVPTSAIDVLFWHAHCRTLILHLLWSSCQSDRSSKLEAASFWKGQSLSSLVIAIKVQVVVVVMVI